MTRAAVDAYLAACAAQRTGTPAPDPSDAVVTVAREDRVELAVTLIAEHRAGRYGGPAYFGAERAFGQLLMASKPLTESEICALARAVGATGTYLCGYPWRFTWEQAERHIAEHDVSAELDDALRVMQASMKVHGSDKNAALKIDRRLFFQPYSALDPAASWGDAVRRDLRAMSEPQAKAWRELLLIAMSVDRAEPKPTNTTKLERASKRVPDIGTRAAEWLVELAADPTRHLAPADADVARALLWIGTPRECPPPEALLTLASHEWKRGKRWTPRHDRMVGALAWALGQRRVPGRAAALVALEKRFKKTTAKYAIALALADATSRSSGA